MSGKLKSIVAGRYYSRIVLFGRYRADECGTGRFPFSYDERTVPHDSPETSDSITRESRRSDTLPSWRPQCQAVSSSAALACTPTVPNGKLLRGRLIRQKVPPNCLAKSRLSRSARSVWTSVQQRTPKLVRVQITKLRCWIPISAFVISPDYIRFFLIINKKKKRSSAQGSILGKSFPINVTAQKVPYFQNGESFLPHKQFFCFYSFLTVGVWRPKPFVSSLIFFPS